MWAVEPSMSQDVDIVRVPTIRRSHLVQNAVSRWIPAGEKVPLANTPGGRARSRSPALRTHPPEKPVRTPGGLVSGQRPQQPRGRKGRDVEHDGVVEELGRQECLALMSTQRLGRLGVVVDGMPLVLPMQFALDGETVILQTNQGAKTLHAPLTSVSFEVDHVDWEQGVGWSVLVQGLGEDISTAIDTRSEERRSLAVHPWAPPPADRWLAIVPRKITGRRIRAN